MAPLGRHPLCSWPAGAGLGAVDCVSASSALWGVHLPVPACPPAPQYISADPKLKWLSSEHTLELFSKLLSSRGGKGGKEAEEAKRIVSVAGTELVPLLMAHHRKANKPVKGDKGDVKAPQAAAEKAPPSPERCVAPSIRAPVQGMLHCTEPAYVVEQACGMFAAASGPCKY